MPKYSKVRERPLEKSGDKSKEQLLLPLKSGQIHSELLLNHSASDTQNPPRAADPFPHSVNVPAMSAAL